MSSVYLRFGLIARPLCGHHQYEQIRIWQCLNGSTKAAQSVISLGKQSLHLIVDIQRRIRR